MTEPEKARALSHYTELAAEAREHIVVTGNTISHPLPPVVPDRIFAGPDRRLVSNGVLVFWSVAPKSDRIGVRRDAGPREDGEWHRNDYEDSFADPYSRRDAWRGNREVGWWLVPLPDAPVRRAECDGKKGLR